MTPIFTVILAHLVGDERLTGRRLAGVLLGFAGVAVLIGPSALSHLDPTNIAELAVLGAAVCYALAGLWGRQFRGLPIEVAAGGMLIGSSALLLPAAALIEHPWTVQPSAIEPRRHCSPWAAQHGDRLSALFQAAGAGGGDQPAAGHLSAAHRGADPGRPVPGRACPTHRPPRPRTDPGRACRHRRAPRCAIQGHFTSGGSDIRIASTLPPVLRPNSVPRS